MPAAAKHATSQPSRPRTWRNAGMLDTRISIYCLAAHYPAECAAFVASDLSVSERHPAGAFASRAVVAVARANGQQCDEFGISLRTGDEEHRTQRLCSGSDSAIFGSFEHLALLGQQ